jgi:DNA-binding MarR family transcriptional regulator/N-acetylglutamate synthase-like GNAT family acetyltransferase
MDALSAVRAFNRFYTRLVGALDADFLGSSVSLPEARLLFEIAQTQGVLAADLQQRLSMDQGFVSRLLSGFERRGWIARPRSGADRRRRPIRLTEAGSAQFALIDRRQGEEVERLLAPLTARRRGDLVAALGLVRALLGQPSEREAEIRTFRPGDLSLIAARQSALYADDYGWGLGLEINVAETAAAFLKNFKAGREQCWVAEVNGAMAGSVMLTDEGGGLSRLRLLYVEPWARGLGLGDALVAACIAFARGEGYLVMTLWTHAVLESARRIYAAHGFQPVETERHEIFGPMVVSETWRLDLTVPQPQRHRPEGGRRP